MYWSKYFIPTLKEVPIGTEAMSHQLMLRAGLVHMLTSGVYSYLPLGLRALRNVENIIREEMENAGARELFLPVLQPIELWKQTGRDQTLADVMYRFEDNRGRDMCLGPTHEEVITDLVKSFVQSYRQLPVVLYQIQTKFRDEMRTRFGVVRACEFIMKDAYSFDRDDTGLKKNYDLMHQAYENIFKRCGLNVVVTKADSGVMGGSISHEFMVPAAIGEDTVKVDGKDQVAMELGHIFQLGTKYSDSLQALFLDEDGKQKPIIMGCYGIGVSRVIAAIVETHNDDKGIIWPEQVAPFDVEILPLASESEPQIGSLGDRYFKELQGQGVDCLVDDRTESPGRKFNDADLIGIPLRVTIGQRNLKNGQVEIKRRSTNEVFLVNKDELVQKIMELRNMFDDVKKRIEDEIAEDLQKHAVEIIDFSIHFRNRTAAIVLLLDYEEGGINLEECMHFNKKITALIENETLIGGEYTVEVSSPGLDRPLRTERDFMRVRGKKIKVHLKQMIENKLEHDGAVQEVDHDKVTISTPRKPVTIPLGLIQKAVQIIGE